MFAYEERKMLPSSGHEHYIKLRLKGSVRVRKDRNNKIVSHSFWVSLPVHFLHVHKFWLNWHKHVKVISFWYTNRHMYCRACKKPKTVQKLVQGGGNEAVQLLSLSPCATMANSTIYCSLSFNLSLYLVITLGLLLKKVTFLALWQCTKGFMQIIFWFGM